MRTTIYLDDDLLRQAKQQAASMDKTLTSLIEDALRAALARRPPPKKRALVQLPTFKGRGLQAGVDLDNTAALLDLMERFNDSH